MTDLSKSLEKLNIPKGALMHFIGIGGIGMSGLAQMYAAAGFKVSGSDRGADRPENRRIFDALAAQGIKIFPQDGSYAQKITPDFLVYSTAIENDNADLNAGKDIPRIHRAAALAWILASLQNTTRIAVAGSCGKTTVTAWLAETMFLEGLDPSFLNGGLANRFCSPSNAGNYYHGTGNMIVFEADESDKSLLAYDPDYALILNIGTDHYSKDELARVFSDFIRKVKKGVVLERNVFDMIDKSCLSHLEVKVFNGGISVSPYQEGTHWHITSYKCSPGGINAVINEEHEIELPVPGIHNATNALAIIALLEMIGVTKEKSIPALSLFKGVWRRNDYAGRIASGAKVYDDYAHNVEKIASCISTAKQLVTGKVFAVFQPHGFGPLGFMRADLLPALESVLSDDDIFIFLPPFYAGGTSLFEPTSEEVVAEYKRKGKKHYLRFPNRLQTEEYLSAAAGKDDIILIMGARDNSLSDWAKAMTGNRN
jgi:UDP-N-acetylmuramate--alanine ligase